MAAFSPADLRNTSVKMTSKSRKRYPSGVKQSRRTFSAGESAGRISARYFGMPPVTQSVSTTSRIGVRPAADPQNARQSRSGISSRCSASETRPTNAFERRMLSRNQAETVPHTTNTRLSRRANLVSHASLRSAGKVLSNAPIHEISSRNTTVLARPFTAAASASNAFAQPSALASGVPVCAASRSQKWRSCVSFVTPSSGATPVISTNRHFDRAANSSTSVDFPTRRRPEQTTNEDDSFPQSPSRASNSCALPMNIAVSFPLGTRVILGGTPGKCKKNSGGYLQK